MKFKILPFLVASLLALVCLAPVGCATLTGANQAQVQIAVQAAVQLSTALYIQKAGPLAADQTARAAKVKVVAVELQGLATGTLTIAQFEQQLAAQIVKLPVDQQILANAILLEVDLQLASKVQNGILDAAAKAAANVVLADVLSVCAMYGA